MMQTIFMSCISPCCTAKSLTLCLWATVFGLSLCTFTEEVRSQDKPQFTRLEPYGAKIGETSKIEVIGGSKNGPWSVWCSDARVQWRTTDKEGIWEVLVPNDLSPGAVWFRFYNDHGATPAKRLLLTSQQPIREREPNDRWSQSQDIAVDQDCVFGTLEKNGDVDHYRLHVKAGERIYVSLDSVRSFRSPLDANLQILDARGFVVAENMDHFGLDPGLEFLPKQDGVHYLRVLGFPVEPNSTISFHGGPEWCYRLRLGRGPLPSEPELSYRDSLGASQDVVAVPDDALEIANAASIVSGQVASGVLRQSKQTHYFRLKTWAGKTIQIDVVAQIAGSRMDPTVTIVDANGKQQAFQDDNNTARDPDLTWSVPPEGDFFLALSDFHRTGSNQHVYWLAVREVSPGVRGTVSTDSFAAKVNDFIEIPLQWDRLANWTGNLEIQRGELPEGTILENNLVAFTKDGPKSSTLKIKLPSPYHGPLKLSIRAASVEAADKGSVGGAAIDSKIGELEGPTAAGCWLSVRP